MMERKCAECLELFHWTKTWSVRLVGAEYGEFVCAGCMNYLETHGLIAGFPEDIYTIHTPLLVKKANTRK